MRMDCRVMVVVVMTVLTGMVAMSQAVSPYVNVTGWTLSSLGNNSISVGGRVPGGVYSDLLAANVLSDGDLYYRYNDMDYRWVSKENWTYSTTVAADKSILNNTRVALVFEGLDTAAEVLLNGESVGTSNNMFVKYLFDIKDSLLKIKTIMKMRGKLLNQKKVEKRQREAESRGSSTAATSSSPPPPPPPPPSPPLDVCKLAGETSLQAFSRDRKEV